MTRETEEAYPDDPEIRRAFLAVELSKRRAATRPAELPSAAGGAAMATQADAVQRWRHRRRAEGGGGGGGGGGGDAGGSHRCGPGCRVDELGPRVYICRASGAVHRCGIECQLAEAEEGRLVCPLTGEVVGDAGDERGGVAGPGPAGEDEEDLGAAGPIGGLGHLFEEGYGSLRASDCPFVDPHYEPLPRGGGGGARGRR